LSKELDVYEKNVFFNDWAPYDDRQNYLLEADVGVSLHFSHLETHFSFRTRLLDYFWAGLPIIVTRGDVLSELIEQHQLGWTVGYESVDDVTAAILESADVSRAEFGDRFAAITPQLDWNVTLQPLIEFCRRPQCAPDRHRARSDCQSLTALKLISQIDAMRRNINAKDERMIHLENLVREYKSQLVHMEHLRNVVAARDAEIERLRDDINQIRQGRVMRLLDGVNHILTGAFLKK